jgi:hypothetical protein
VEVWRLAQQAFINHRRAQHRDHRSGHFAAHVVRPAGPNVENTGDAGYATGAHAERVGGL